MKALKSIGALVFLLYALESSATELFPIEHFARMPALSDVSISPDGRYLAAVQSVGDKTQAVLFDLENGGAMRPLMGGDKDGLFRMSWCNWANVTRLVCGYRAVNSEMGVLYPISRMAAVNANGSDIKVLIQNGKAGGSQFQDGVLDWTPSQPDTVLVQADEDQNGFPEVYELNVYTGSMGLRVRERQPIRMFVSDRDGSVRLGYGMSDLILSYFARLPDERGWLQLEKFKAFSKDPDARLEPVAIGSDKNKVLAVGSHEGRDALWEMDLTDRDNPVLIFSHPAVDARSPILAKDGRLIGIFYETDRPFAFYTDPLARKVIAAVDGALPAGNYNVIVDSTPDGNLFVIRSQSDVEGPSYYLLDRVNAKLSAVGGAYPELGERREKLARMRSIKYPARDGVEIPGYLTVPVDKRAEKLPLIVMPHGGPVSRDSWEYDFLVQFLANRGHAVLQMNFRGSSGYGDDWFYAAHQDWGGLTYDDITDATRWAIKEGIADPERICIVGWSFGGYAALLGAVRNGNLYRCSISIAGVSDLIDLKHDQAAFTNAAIAREQIGKNTDKLKEDSPRRHAAETSIPILMVHGDRDFQVRIEHSEDMASALKRAKKPFKLVKLKGATHQLDRQSDRMTLLSEIEAFLKANL